MNEADLDGLVKQAVAEINADEAQAAADRLVAAGQSADKSVAGLLLWLADQSGRLSEALDAAGSDQWMEEGESRDEALARLARSALEVSAQLGVHDAMDELARRRSCGAEGYEEDTREAVRLWTIAAEQGHASSLSRLGVMRHHGKGTKKDPRRALKEIRQASEMGSARATWYLGEAYLAGTWFEEIPQDEELAFRHLSQAAESGYEVAALTLGRCYLGGIGTQPNAKRAVKWLTAAASSDLDGPLQDRARRAMASAWFTQDISEEDGVDRAEVLSTVREMAETGDANSMFMLGRALSDPDLGGTRSSPDALRWSRKSALLGHAGACYDVGKAHAEGWGTHQDLSAARSWYAKGSEAGGVSCALALAWMLTKGLGGSEDPGEATRLYGFVASHAEDDSTRVHAKMMIARLSGEGPDGGSECVRRSSGTMKRTRDPKELSEAMAPSLTGFDNFIIGLVVAVAALIGTFLLVSRVGAHGLWLAVIPVYIFASVRRISVESIGVPLFLGSRIEGWAFGEGLQIVPALVMSHVEVDTRQRSNALGVVDVLTRPHIRARIRVTVNWRVVSGYRFLGAASDALSTGFEDLLRRAVAARCRDLEVAELRELQGSDGGPLLGAAAEAVAPLGLGVLSVSVTEIVFSQPVTSDIERPARKEFQADAEQRDLLAFRARVEELRSSGYTLQEATEVVQIERKKIGKSIRDFRLDL